MPPVKGNSAVADKLAQKLKKHTSSHANDETKFGSGGELSCPVAGTAQLEVVKFGVYNAGTKKAGETYVYFNGIALTPPSEVGKRVTKMIPLCNDPPAKPGAKYTPRTEEDYIAQALNMFRVLGGDAITNDMETKEDWENVMAALTQAAPEFRYHTYPSKPHPQQAKDPTWKPYVNVEYDRAVANGEADGEVVADAVQDNTGDGSEAPSDEEVDWESLGEQAAAGDPDAAAKITEAANELGIFAEVYGAPSWQEGAEMVAKAKGGGGSEAGEGEGEGESLWMPAEGETYKLKLKGTKKAEDYSVTKVFEKAGTLNLRRESDKQVLKSKPFDTENKTIDGCPVES